MKKSSDAGQDQADPGVVEEWKWMNPVWSHDGIICTGESYKKAVKLTFARGAALKDTAVSSTRASRETHAARSTSTKEKKLTRPPSRRSFARRSPSTVPVRPNHRRKPGPGASGKAGSAAATAWKGASMEVRSLAYRTDLMFAAFDGEIIDRGQYLVIRTPTNPSFHWGNYLLFEHPPAEGDYPRWQELFATEIGTPPQVIHRTFGWDAINGEPGVIDPFVENGYHVERSVVLTTRRPGSPPDPAQGVTVRPFRAEDDWAQSVEIQVECRDPGFAEADYRLFSGRQMERYRAMTQAGLGAWFGAFAGNRLVADLGIYCSRRLGRYQSVQTHPEFRRKGMARRLVCEAGAWALDRFGLDTLVIVAEAGSPAERLYQSSGFETVEQQIGIEKRDVGD